MINTLYFPCVCVCNFHTTMGRRKCECKITKVGQEVKGLVWYINVVLTYVKNLIRYQVAFPWKYYFENQKTPTHTILNDFKFSTVCGLESYYTLCTDVHFSPCNILKCKMYWNLSLSVSLSHSMKSERLPCILMCQVTWKKLLSKTVCLYV